MTIEISTRNVYGALRGPSQRLQSQLDKVQIELSSGRLSDIGRELGAGAALSTSLRNQLAELQSYIGSHASVTARLDATQNALGALSSVGGSLQQTILTAGAGATGTSALVSSAQAAFAQIISLANSSFAGQFLFAGTQTNTRPLADYYSATTSPAKAAVDTAFSGAFGVSQGSPAAGSISGAAMQSFLDNQFASLFSADQWKSNWSSASDSAIQSRLGPGVTIASSISANEDGVRALTEAATMVSDLGIGTLGNDARAAVLNTATSLIGKALGELTTLSSRVGAGQSQVSATSGLLKTQSDYLQTRVDTLESVDPAEASTRLTMLSTNLQIAYEMTAKISQLSLVRFL